jgi:hypothetical protein
MDFQKKIVRFLQNIPGFRTNRKLIVIESDDWGSIRMPSANVYSKLLKEGFQVQKDPFLKYDSLASESDITNLLEVLSDVRDKNDMQAKLTMNTIMTNPDFEKINQSDFQQYHYELFTDTLSKYPEHKNSFNIWKQGMDNNLLRPQYHGREHLNVDRWMMALQKRDKNVLEAFNNEMISISSEPSEMRFGYMEELDYFTNEEKAAKNNIVFDGLKLFEEVFGFKPLSFIGCCFVWDEEVEKILSKNGVKYLQGVLVQNKPVIDSGTKYKYNLHYLGQSNDLSQKYLVRNAFFEPSVNPFDPVGKCMREIGMAFMLGKPAIISAHRLNFIGFIDPKNRDRNLRAFNKLLKSIISKWPDAEFLFSDELGVILD